MWPFKRKPLAAVAHQLNDRELISRIVDDVRKDGTTTDLQRGVFSYWCLQAECKNGTIDQYFTNSTADGLPSLIVFLKEAGAESTIEALKEIMDLYRDGDGILPRSDRIDVSLQHREEDEEAWEGFVRSQNEKIIDTFPQARKAIAAHVRKHLQANS